MKSQRGFALPELVGGLLGIVFVLGAIIGYVLNIIKVVGMDSIVWTGETVARIVGIFIPPVGAIMGWM